MRAMMKVAAVGLALAGSVTVAWSAPASLKSAPKSLATVKSNTVNALASSLDRSVNVAAAPDAKAMKSAAVNSSLKSGANTSEGTIDPHRSGLANQKSSASKFAGGGSDKSAQLQAFAGSNLANAGLHAATPALKTDGAKEKDQLNRLR